MPGVVTSGGTCKNVTISPVTAPIRAPTESDASAALVLTQDVTDQETRVEQLSLLRELSQFLQGTLDAERLYHVILLCVTTGHALGFNRAFLFTRNRTADTLDAQMAVGPASREDAFRIWAELSAQGVEPSDELAQRVTDEIKRLREERAASSKSEETIEMYERAMGQLSLDEADVVEIAAAIGVPKTAAR